MGPVQVDVGNGARLTPNLRRLQVRHAFDLPGTPTMDAASQSSTFWITDTKTLQVDHSIWVLPVSDTSSKIDYASEQRISEEQNLQAFLDSTCSTYTASKS